MPDWEALYQASEMGWDRGCASPALQKWWDEGNIVNTDHVLIPGCGLGHEVVALAKLGVAVTALDIAPSAIEAVSKELALSNLHATVACVDLFTYTPAQPFDVIYEQTCLCAIQPEQRHAYEQRLHAWLNDGGSLLMLLMQTGEAGGPPFHCDWAEMKQLFPSSRWHWQASDPMLITRQHVSKKGGIRYELGFVLKKHGG